MGSSQISIQNLTREIESITSRNLHLCDVGARWGIEKPWKSFRDIIDLISFEPDKEEYNLLVKKKNPNDMIYPYALSNDQKKAPLNLTKNRGNSSLYKPNYDFLKNYPYSDKFRIEETITVEVTSLDALHSDKIITNMDFIKIDVQGAELDVLKGGENLLLENILGVEVEVEFQPLYEYVPLFSDIDSFIRNSLGLQIQDLRKAYWKYSEGINIGATKGQLVFGDALYFRPPQDIVSWCSNFHKDEASNKLDMACLMGIVYGYLDYSLCLLNQPLINDFIEIDKINRWMSIIHHYGKSLYYKGRGARYLSDLFNLLSRMCQPTQEGSSGQHLGARKKFGIFR